MTRDELATLMREHNEDALLADGFELAFLGPAERCGQPTLASYSAKRALRVLVERDGMSYEEAVEWFGFNVVGAWAGPGTPVWIRDDGDE